MNVDQLQDKLRKRKTSLLYKNIPDERLLTDMKENYPLYVHGGGLEKNQLKK